MKRDKTLDYAKGLVIVLMVIGHCYSQDNSVLTLIYGFHMAFFFTVSGLIYGSKSRTPDFHFKFSRVFKHLLLPYFFYELIFSIFISLLDKNQSFSQSLLPKFISIFGFKGVTATWYLSCIAFVELLFFGVFSIHRSAVYPFAVIAFIGGFLLAPYAQNYAIVPVRCMIGLGFFTLGFSLGERNWPSLAAKVKGWMIPCLILLYCYTTLTNGMVALVKLQLGNSFLYVINAILGSTIIILLVYHLKECHSQAKLKSILEKLGRNTLFILGTHMLFVEIFRLLDYKLFGNLFSKFGIGEGIFLGALVCSFEYCLIPAYLTVKKHLHLK